MYEVHSNKLISDFEEWYGVKLPTYKIVCPCCHGKGVHDHPAFSNGISQDEFDEDPDFFEAYMEGRYDVPCEECNGNNVVDSVDTESLSEELKAEWEAHAQGAYDMHAEWLAEVRMGC